MIIQLYIHGELRTLNISNCNNGKDIKVAISKIVHSFRFCLIY